MAQVKHLNTQGVDLCFLAYILLKKQLFQFGQTLYLVKTLMADLVLTQVVISYVTICILLHVFHIF